MQIELVIIVVVRYQLLDLVVSLVYTRVRAFQERDKRQLGTGWITDRLSIFQFLNSLPNRRQKRSL
jgi:hypothetical protein